MYMAPIFPMRGSFPKLMQMFQKSIQIEYLILKKWQRAFLSNEQCNGIWKKKKSIEVLALIIAQY